MNETMITIVYMANHPWGGLRRRSHHLASALAKSSCVNRVLYVNPMLDTTGLFPGRDGGDSGTSRRTVRPTHDPAGPVVITPVRWLPWSGRVNALARAGTAIEARRIERAAVGPFTLVSNAVSLRAERLLTSLSSRHPFVFDLTDDFTQFDSFRKDPRVLRGLEDRLRRYATSAIAVTAVNEHVAEFARRIGADPVLLPNGADLDFMIEGEGGDLPGPIRDLAGKQLLGYTGVLTRARIDIDLLLGTLDRLEGWTLVVVGDQEESLARELRGRTDVRIVPRVPYAELPGYYRSFSVCVIPHLDNEHTRGNDPLKLYEYLAAGKPVVTTPIAGTAPFRHVAAIENDPERFARAVSRMAGENAPEKVRARREALAPHSWKARAETLLSLIRRGEQESKEKS